MKRIKEIRKKRISVSSAKAKGRDLQKWVCQQISEIINLPWGQDTPIESRGMGQPGVDIRLDKEAIKKFPFSVECKRQESWGIHKWIKQAKNNKRPDTNWLLICKRNHENPIVLMDAEIFFKLLSKKV